MSDKLNLRPQRKNANKHTLHGTRLLEKSIQQDGFIDAQTAAADGEIISGSLRLEVTAEKFADVEPIIVHSTGDRPVIVIRDDIPNADDPRAKRLSIAANQIGATDWSPDSDLLKAWGHEDEDIKAMFSDSEWVKYTGEFEPFDPKKAWEGMPEHISEEIRDNAITCIVRFLTEDARKDFEEFLGWKLSHKGKTYSTWYPKSTLDQLGKGLEFTDES